MMCYLSPIPFVGIPSPLVLSPTACLATTAPTVSRRRRFIIHISNETKHYERFAVRSKYMTLEPKSNRYIEHFEAIRIIQRHLVRQADSCLLPKVDNTNVDRSVVTIHTTVLRCLARTGAGASLYDPVRQQVAVMNRVFDSHHEAAWSSKAMLQVIN